jgi:hypothetical protein
MLEQYTKYAPWAGNGSSLGKRSVMDAVAAMQERQLQGMDAAIGGGLAFLQAELEKRDPTVHEPLTSVTWMRDMPIDSGGGWNDTTSNFYADYAISGANGLGIQAGESTSIPIAQANIRKEEYLLFNWFNQMRITFVDMQKTQQIGRTLDQLYENSIKLNWNKSLDQQVYIGPISPAGSTPSYPGLINNPNITAALVATGASGQTAWSTKTPTEIMQDMTTLIVATWAASNYDVTGMACNLLIPPSDFALISQTPVTTAGSVSILTYYLANNIARTQGIDLKIFPLRWCIGAGQSSTARMVGYVAKKNKIYMDITVPIQRVMTVPTVSGGGAYETLFGGQIGLVKPLYYYCVQYADGI